MPAALGAGAGLARSAPRDLPSPAGAAGWSVRSTATSCRSTSNPASLEAGERPSRTSQPQSRAKIKYSRRRDTANPQAHGHASPDPRSQGRAEFWNPTGWRARPPLALAPAIRTGSAGDPRRACRSKRARRSCPRLVLDAGARGQVVPGGHDREIHGVGDVGQWR